MSDTQTLEISKIIPAPPGQVYKSFLSSVALESWFSDYAEATASENGRFYAWWDAGHYASGKFIKLEENNHISLTWQGQGESTETKVDIYFEESGDSTQVKIIHSGLGTEGHWVHSVEAIRSGWEYSLTILLSVFETGLDKRIYDRPMLGIYPSQLIDEKIAQKLGLPITTGIEISGVLEGLGAEAAGMQEKDVIYSMNGRELKAFLDFGASIGGKKVGDVVEVIFYRGAEKHTVEMKLSGRPIPEIPESAQAFAKQAKEGYQAVNDELDEILIGLTEEEVSIRPEPEEWSVKETLAHLLYTERWVHLSISCAVSDQRSGGFANELSLISAMANSYTLEGLVTELKNCEKITIASFEVLPEEFTSDKRRFTNLTQSFAGNFIADHVRSHFPQIKDAIEAARG